jgi:putative toxin-antitoxin system antitoxin component (TIGR02293 family)
MNLPTTKAPIPGSLRRGSAARRKPRVSGFGKGGGIVRYYVHGEKTGAAGTFNTSKLIRALEAGLPVGELNALQTSLAMPMEKLVPMLGISKATLHRRKVEGKLDVAESDRVIRFARLMGKAIEVLESEQSARQWLTSPQFGLGGAMPLKYAETEVGAREVENLLGRIEYGVYS